MLRRVAKLERVGTRWSTSAKRAIRPPTRSIAIRSRCVGIDDSDNDQRVAHLVASSAKTQVFHTW